jgi:hypothetical protein
MSWSENRKDTKSYYSPELKREKLRQINLVLEKLANDEEFHDDLKLPVVIKALNHWTNKERLPAEDASALQDNRRVVCVLQRIQMLQSVCRDAQIPLPLELVLKKAHKISNEIAIKLFGQDVIDPIAPSTLKSPSNDVKIPEQKKEVNDSAKKVKIEVNQNDFQNKTGYFGWKTIVVMTILAIGFGFFLRNNSL